MEKRKLLGLFGNETCIDPLEEVQGPFTESNKKFIPLPKSIPFCPFSCVAASALSWDLRCAEAGPSPGCRQ
jgi:hypothetical protein